MNICPHSMCHPFHMGASEQRAPYTTATHSSVCQIADWTGQIGQSERTLSVRRKEDIVWAVSERTISPIGLPECDELVWSTVDMRWTDVANEMLAGERAIESSISFMYKMGILALFDNKYVYTFSTAKIEVCRCDSLESVCPYLSPTALAALFYNIPYILWRSMCTLKYNTCIWCGIFIVLK